ncbi:P-loop containing nucleoside triphosphate hydrolase [Glarea lozoyensis ATCC 20868]|uniref:TATA-binding protein-associated factor mot1 n=1 Tax=Glarea lozoyensis (strain ATCC 20868 / MF5171) TaxID=1116229 RepID=S3DBG9_GLAL2|nr:P-loop containing nucleoside triphosphate hydrolase [Glarea lozoyensis ATCC 20868]EPE35095.1 P-loop containing nucleoside triphosphate hydrolase [Glarea lozoyensis ATCC 20868]
MLPVTLRWLSEGHCRGGQTGSTPLIRNTAAQQLADVQKAHPEELFNLLTRVVPYLRHKTWETRTAAAKALGGICDNAEKYDPNAGDGSAKSETKKEEQQNGFAIKKEEPVEEVPLAEGQLSLDTLDLPKILKYGKELLRGGGKEVDYVLAQMDPAQRLAHQKKTLMGRLGLLGEYLEEDMDLDYMVKPNGAPTPQTSNGHSNSDSKPSKPGATPDETGLSARQLNQLKRKRKREAQNAGSKNRLVDLSIRRSSTIGSSDADTAMSDIADDPNGVSDYFSMERTEEVDEDSKVVSEFKGPVLPIKSELQADAEVEGGEWPFDRLCELLMVDLFDPQWETRHGAAMGLREIIRVHGGGAGRVAGKPRSQNDAANQRWLDDLACRLCCVFMLDRFGDYVSDTVVAPIRETVGQTLGALLSHLPASSVYSVHRVLYRMVMQTDLQLDKPGWAVCHGGMIGLRYLVAVRNDLLLKDSDLIDGVIQAVMKGLGDFDDDVRSVSAATLIPIAKEFVNLRPEALDGLINIVWECLSNLGDDLSASTGQIMDLLAKLCSFPEVLEAMKKNAARDSEQSFALLVPRLYPFLRHTITSVRSAVLRALLTFVNIEGDHTRDWLNGKILRLIFQNVLVERNLDTLNLSLQVWKALVSYLAKDPEDLAEQFSAHIDPLMQLTLHPIGVSRHPLPMNATLFQKPSGSTYTMPSGVVPVTTRPVSPPSPAAPPPKKQRRKSTKIVEPAPTTSSHDVDGHMMQGDVDLVGMEILIRSRISAARAMGLIMSLVPVHVLEAYDGSIIPAMTSAFSSTQLTASMIIDEYAKNCVSKDQSRRFIEPLLKIIESDRPAHYRDLVSYTQLVRAQCVQLLNTFRDQGKVSQHRLPTLAVVVQGEPEAGPDAFSIQTADKVVGDDFDRLKKAMAAGQRLIATQALTEAREGVVEVIESAKLFKEQRDVRIKAAAASALVAMKFAPKKPTHIIKGMMDSAKKEDNVELQQRSAGSIARLVELFAETGRSGPAQKVVGNLAKFSCQETSETPEFSPNAAFKDNIQTLRKEEDRRDHPDAVKFAREQKAARITRRGTKEALDQLSGIFGAELFQKVPTLRSIIEEPLHHSFAEELPADAQDPNQEVGQSAIDAMSILRALTPTMHKDLHPFIMQLLPLVVKALHAELSVFRYMAAKCLATVCSVITVEGMTMLVEKVLPSISNPVDLNFRQGAIEAVYHLISVMGDGILPYVIFLIVPVLGRMSDSDNDVRLIATTTFATLVKLVPLEAGIPDPPGLSQELLKGRDRERTFIAQLLDPHKVEPFHIPVAIKAELRSYQQEGVNWLNFLNKYHLHGILCDDMGLGKTLQTLCIVASDHHLRAEEFAKTQSPDARRLPSLIVCPPTLSGHWQQEINHYAPFLTCTAYVGPPVDRARLRDKLGSTDIVITSYDICRNDAEVLTPFNWNYLVLDEGHLIKNPRAKVTIAVKRLLSNHRLILSGTPIQNNVLELWSLFDFLMPGFLGAEKVFLDRFAKPIAASRFSKSSSKEQEAGALAIEALHKQVLPFLLRRLKEEVLDDLPPKILQNYYCDLSDLQKKLFEDFTKKEGKTLAEKASAGDKEAKQHIFQALQYMRKLCNSPALVMKEGHKQYVETQRLLAKQGTSLSDPIHAPKLTALRDLLVDCGIGIEPASENDLTTEANFVSPHRALIFCQMKEMLDMVQNDVLKKMLPSVQYLRMDGSVDASKRQDIVNKFNSDPSYDCLLLTTSVGGLGLNLTGADTVIFVEHDWNPQKDLQAMDRAHRIGQKKVVNVYRLITRGTLEEKIMSLQRFKIDVASTVVNQQNAGLGTMETDQILDLFNLGDTADLPSLEGNKNEEREEDMVDATGEVREKGKKGWLDDLGELWDDKQYEESFDLDGFLKSMQQ